MIILFYRILKSTVEQLSPYAIVLEVILLDWWLLVGWIWFVRDYMK